MKMLYVGDFRCEQFRDYQSEIAEKVDNQGYESIIYIEKNADCDWFTNVLTSQLEFKGQANLVFLLGFIDCVYCCTWESFTVDSIIEKYKNCFKNIIKSCQDITLYIYSVNPVSSNYYFNGAGRIILKEELETTINKFNAELKKCCEELEITYVDSNKYLTDTAGTMHDGIRYTLDTCIQLKNLILSNIAELSYSILFDQRTSTPDPNEDSYKYWINKEYDGLNKCTTDVVNQHKDSDGNTIKGSVLPNCTGYAWGRFYEILREEPKLSIHNAEYWYIRDGKSKLEDGTTYKEACKVNGWGKNDGDGFGDNDGYERGQIPRRGAIMCWEGVVANGINANGHVEIVEDVSEDGETVYTTASGYGEAEVWWKNTRKKGDGNWGAGKDYKFQGFIYLPYATGTAVSKDELCTRNSYKITTDDMKPNAQYIWQYLGIRGWTINAVAALLGNLQNESKLSPCVWESTVAGSTINADGTHTLNKTALQAYYDTIITKSDGTKAKRGRYPGYGLVQWTSYTKLYDWCNDGSKNGTGTVLPYWDMDSQLARIIWEVENKKQWDSVDYTYKEESFKNLSFKDFTTSLKDPGWLAAAFAFNYEKPASSDNVLSDSEKNNYGSVDAVRLALCNRRAGLATEWYNYLKGLPSIFISQDLEVSNFKVDKKEPTKVQLSAIIKNSKKVKYNLFKGTTADTKTSELISKENIVYDSEKESEPDFLTFTIKDNIVPNITYTVELYVEGMQENDTKTLTLTFKTPQDYPQNVKNISLSVLNESFPKGDFKISFEKPKSWGYWQRNNHGYEVALFVNNKIKKIIEVDKNLDYFNSFNLNDYFGDIYNNFKLGDNIQIGIRTWVEYSGNKLFSSDFYGMSNPICLLKKPVIIYLNI